MLDGLPITIVDLVVVGSILLFAVLASFWGFMGLVTGIGAWIGAGAVAILYYPQAQDLARRHIETELFADLAAGIGLFAGALILFLVVSAVLSHMVKESALGSINRALGFVSGVALGYVVACVFLIGSILVFTEEELPGSVTDARLYPLVRAGGVALLATVPDELKTEGLSTLEKTKTQVDDAQRAKELYDTLNNPKPRSGDDPAQEGADGTEDADPAGASGDQGYAPAENDQLDNLLDQVDR
ncbi:MAG: CvpA family protein [Marivibrio sp.]|uniref:CvpA family protein n=1 Tax=Marivibrio sp. TaxID=2039719 RepID=UPI0032EDA9FB